jgi:AAHS family benzoate transporter-like MFS transporter
VLVLLDGLDLFVYGATGAWLFSAQTLVYAAVGAHYPAGSRATALGWVAGVGRFGAVFGPWLGGVLVASGLSTPGFGVFAVAGLLGAAMVAPVRRPAQVTAGSPRVDSEVPRLRR